MEELVDLKLPGLHLCVAGRPEIDIGMVLEPLKHFQISLHDDSGQKEDIIAYIKAIVHSDRMVRRLKKEDQNLVVDKLSQNADGSFRWVVCQVDALRYSLPISIRRVIGDLPPSLDETYEKALLGINKAKREYALQLYQCLMVSIRPLRVEELAETLAIRFDEAVSPMFNAAWRPENAEEAVMSICSSLIAIVDRGGHQVVQFSHFSIKEYLTSERLAAAEEHLSYYHVLPEPAHTILAHASLSILLHLDDNIDRDTIGYFPLAPYAARHWTDHAQFRNVSSHTKEAMKRLFDPAKPHFAVWVWLYDIDRYWTERMPTMHPTQPEAVPLYYASLCGFVGLVEHLLVAHPQDVNARGGHHVTSLNAALDKGHVKVAQLLLQHGADVNAPDDQSRTPLHIAAEDGDTEVIQSLIDHGADTNAKDFEQSIPLSLASRRGRRGAAQLLLEHGADVSHQDSVGQTPIHEALDNGHVDIVRLLLDRGADASAQGRSLRTPLHLAADLGELVLSQLLIERGAEVDARDKMDWTPLHFASEHEDPEILRFLISQGANTNARNKDQETPLFLASRKGKLEAARLLSEHSTDIDSQNSLGRTPLHVAAENGHYDTVHLLLNQGAGLNAPEKKKKLPTPPEKKLLSPLHLAADQGMLKVAELLLEYGAEVDARDEMDRTPLHFAAQQGHLELVRLLLENHADVLALNREDHTFLDVAWANGHKEIVDVTGNARYEGGQTALHIAAQHGDTKLMSWLIHRKLDPILPNVEDEDQETPLFPASRNGKLEATRLLLDGKAEVNHQDWQKMTPLHGASENGHDAVAQLLLERNAEVDAKHKNAWTPLHLASRAGQGNVAKVLLDKDALVNAKNDSNWTPLHMASQEGHLDVVRLLLGHGAEVNTQNKTDETALHLAAFYAHLDVAQVLLDHGADPQIKNKKGETPGTLKSKSKGGKTLLELAQERGDDSMAGILKLAALGRDELGEMPIGEPARERQFEEQVEEEQVEERVMIPE
ncbi:Ankyrin repeat-containing domain protein [Russula decolorans]